ncbi:MAG: TlyA family rRNA (cytidine-2'-O)-methyltransferase, partial [Verrucomicrobia bacterium]
KGIIKDSGIHKRIVEGIIHFSLTHLPNASLIGQMSSPIKGTDGNQEFLLGLKKF